MSDERDGEILGFLAASGWGDAARLPLGADWSNRRYERLRRASGSAILMDAAADAPVGAFVAVARWLRGTAGLHAPEILAADEAARLLLLEDMGDELLARAVANGADEAALYRLALDVILRFQDAAPPGFLPVLDEAGLLALLDVYLEFAIPPPGAAAREEFAAVWRGLLPLARVGPDVFLHRDYHAENLLWLPREAGLWRLGVLDFQDAFAGPAAYDVASLVQDARRDVAPGIAAGVVEAYLAARPGLGRADFGVALAVLGAQRAMRILGVVGRLAATRGRSFPKGMRARVRGHLEASLGHPALAELRRWCDRHAGTTSRDG